MTGAGRQAVALLLAMLVVAAPAAAQEALSEEEQRALSVAFYTITLLTVGAVWGVHRHHMSAEGRKMLAEAEAEHGYCPECGTPRAEGAYCTRCGHQPGGPE